LAAEPAAEGEDELWDELADVVAREVAARRAGEWGALRALIHPQAGAKWVDQQRNLLDPGLADVAITRVEQAGEWALAAVIVTVAPEDGPPTQVYTLRAFRRAPTGEWLLTAPEPRAWGEVEVLAREGLRLEYRAFDAPYVRAVAPRIAVILPRMAADFGIELPVDEALAVRVLPAAGAADVPSPLYPGFPLELAQSPEEFLLGYLTDSLGHALLHQEFGAAAQEAGRLAVAHPAIQWEVQRSVQRDFPPQYVQGIGAEPTPLRDLLDPTALSAAGSRTAERDLFFQFAVATYGSGIVAPYLAAAFEAASAEELVQAAIGAELGAVEGKWQRWRAMRLDVGYSCGSTRPPCK
jgi:hypothetical protein